MLRYKWYLPYWLLFVVSVVSNFDATLTLYKHSNEEIYEVEHMPEWHAKPSGSFSVGSQENIDNATMIASWCRSNGFSDSAIISLLGNIQGESGMNPWRYQSDYNGPTGGYGLFQYTPKSGYLNSGGYGYGYPYFAPNRSVTTVTNGALPTDGICQLEAISRSGKYFGNDVSGRYDTFTALGYSREEAIFYGNFENFRQCNDPKKATACWLCFFEAPETINSAKLELRYNLGVQIWNSIGGVVPDVPTPTPTTSNKYSKWWLIKRRQYYANNCWFNG